MEDKNVVVVFLDKEFHFHCFFPYAPIQVDTKDGNNNNLNSL
jgi:hypothetical protein